MSASKKKTALLLDLDLPQEILVEILAKLPAKSLVRFRCVSKFLYSLPVHPVFADLHHSRSLTLPSRATLLISVNGKSCPATATSLAHYTINFSGETQGKLQANRVRYLDGEPCRKGQLGSYSNGLVCLVNRGGVTIFNISTRQCTRLPTINKSTYYWTCPLLGFDSFAKRYKVLMPIDDHKYKVFTLGVDKSWRVINLPRIFYPFHNFGPEDYNTSVHIDGVIYTYNRFTNGFQIPSFEIGAFEVRTENLCMIPFPNEISEQYYDTHYYSRDFLRDSALLEVEGRLAIVLLLKRDNLCFMDVWTWEKPAGRWERLTIPIPLEGSEIIIKATHFRFTTNHAGEIVLLCRTREQFSILVCNFNSQVWRNFEIVGFEDYRITYPLNVTMYNIVDNIFSYV